MSTTYVPFLHQESPDAGQLILRDGSTAVIRRAAAEDAPALGEFFRRLQGEASPFSFSAQIPQVPDLGVPPERALTLLVTRQWEGQLRIIGVGSYWRREEGEATLAMAVDPRFRGKGIGLLLLERLALCAAMYGFTQVWVRVSAGDSFLWRVLQESGFPLREETVGEERWVRFSTTPGEAGWAKSEVRERVYTAASIRPFFWPQSVAVVGASRDPSAIGHRILQALVMSRFQGPVYPVNPKARAVGSVRAYGSVREIPDRVDLAVIAVPREQVLGVVEECAERGVRALVVITAGFAEVGEEGKRLQARLVEKVRSLGMRMVGPNCMGLLNTDPRVRLNATFSPVYPPHGKVAMSSQSGALGVAILDLARHLEVGLSTFVSVGNKADVSGNDLLQYWEEDEGTDVILLYLESFGNPRRFARIARRVSRRKPVVVVKSGRTGAGRRAASSHTAALASSEAAVGALFRQTGVIRADTLEEMFGVAVALAHQPLPRGRRVAIVTNAGGPGILCADACEASGLEVPELGAETQSRLARFLPPAAGLRNPVDMIASAGPESYRRTLEVILSSPEVDAVIAICVPVEAETIGAIRRAIGEGVRTGRQQGWRDKTVLACLMAEQGRSLPLRLKGETIPSYPFPEAPARVLGKLAAYAAWRRQPPGRVPRFSDTRVKEARELCQSFSGEQPRWLPVEETRRLLEYFGLPVLQGGVALSEEEAVARAEELGFPVVLKLASTSLIHKTEVGGVKLGIRDGEGVRKAFREIRAELERRGRLEAMQGVLVQPMLRGGVELMVGVTDDPVFGPLVAFGLGGIHVEVLADVVFRVTPLSDLDASQMIREIRGFRLLEGYRGHPPADLQAVQEILLRVSHLVEELPQICELDLNPLFAFPPGQGCAVVDARVRIQGEGGP